MTEIQRPLVYTIDELDVQEKRDNRPCFSISFTRNRPGLFVTMYVVLLATLVIMLRSETLVDSVWSLVALLILFNAFFFSDVYSRYRYEDTDVLGFHARYSEEWYNTRFVLRQLIERILQSLDADSGQRAQLKKMVATKDKLSFYDALTLTRVGAAQWDDLASTVPADSGGQKYYHIPAPARSAPTAS